MGLSIVHGRILLEYGKGEKSGEYLQSIGRDESWPFISADMFSPGAKERPQYYDQRVFAFAATYKNVEYGGFKAFVLKFEQILRNLEFDTACIHLETEVMGTYHLFWKKITSPDTLEDRYKQEDFQLIKTDDWYFGFGYRNHSGSLEMKLEKEHIFDFEE